MTVTDQPIAQTAPGTSPSFDMTPEEQAFYRENGYLVREAAFDARECAAIARDCEALLAELAARPPTRAMTSGTHPLHLHEDIGVTVKWERARRDQIRGIEPFAHIAPPLDAWARDPRFTDPCRFACGAEAVDLFTEKLHTKRARTGGEIETHQDYPYWIFFAPQAAQVVTAILHLDEATRTNGCLEVAPGSHKDGVRPTRTDVTGIDKLRMDPAKFDASTLVPIEAPAGSILFLDSLVVHRSAPNASDQDRRALLFSYQPAGLPHSREMLAAS